MTRHTRTYSTAALALAGLLVIAACGGAPQPAPGQTPGGGVPGGDQARAELCGTGPNSLQNTATGLSTVNADTDDTQLLEMIEGVRTPLNQVQVEGPAQAGRDAANEALTQLEATIVNPDARQAAATTAAGALRQLHDVLCV
jgi:hypothetical protein